VAATVAKIDQFNYVTTLFITPLFLVAGTFFPIDQLPKGVQIASQLNPLHHLVELVRHASFGFESTDLLRVAFLIVVAIALWRVAVNRMEKRLIDYRGSSVPSPASAARRLISAATATSSSAIPSGTNTRKEGASSVRGSSTSQSSIGSAG
jgi:ABC-2 type transporter